LGDSEFRVSGKERVAFRDAVPWNPLGAAFPAKSVLASVKKEMAKPRIALSAKKRKGGANYPMTKPVLHLASMMRGLYARAAKKFGVHPSYVSRIARGERHSPEIESFLKQEGQRILASASKRKSKRR
jgi:hypothetical protein